MAKINLLPWRQELRKQRQQEFIAFLMAVVIVAAGIVLVGHMALSNQVSGQEERNAFIKAEIAKLDGQIKEIDELQKRREELLGRMKVIQDLQGRRPVIVRIFDEFVRVVPDGVHLTSLARVGDTFKISGVAESANQVSALMRNLDASPWFQNPQLSKVAADAAATAAKSAAAGDEKQPGSKFSMTVALESVEKQEGDAKGDAEAGAKKEGAK